MKPASKIEVKLLGSLFDNNDIGNIIARDDLEIAKSYNNIAVILLALFIPWDCL